MTSQPDHQADYSGQYALAGPVRNFDPRITPIRGDLADIALAGKLFAPHYAVPMERAIASPFAALRKAGDAASEQTSELLAGERFMLLDVSGGWGWGWCAHDHYNGYLPLDVLADPAGDAPVIAAGDPVKAALARVGMAYVWGGRGGAGIDCSGLVQTSFAAAGHALPRDSDQQAACGVAVDGAMQRRDLAFFPGHVVIALGDGSVVHASMSQGKVMVEPLADVIARKGDPTAVRRLA